MSSTLCLVFERATQGSLLHYININFCTIIDSLMEREREEESGEMYSPNESGEYTPHGDALNFTVQGLQDALTEAESVVMEPPTPADEFIIQLEVTMVD